MVIKKCKRKQKQFSNADSNLKQLQIIFYELIRIKNDINWTEAANGGVLQKYYLKNFTKSTGKHLCRNLFF